MSVADLKKRYDAIDWEVLFDELGKVQVAGIDRAIVGQPSFFEGMNKLVKQTPIETLRCYLAAQYLTSAASYLSDDFYAASFDFFGRQMAGKEEQRPRWKRAMSIPNSVLGEAVGEMYVAKYFPAKDKERMLELVGNLQTALGEHIAALDWMSDATKAKAQEKLASFHVKIGYPDKWKDYSTLTIDPSESYWQNIKAASLWGTLDNLRKFGKPVDKDEWLMSPQTVNAYYNPTTNEICFPAAILQPPFYNPDADDAVNYGAIGVVIGHEMTHGFDDQGRNFDKDGNMNNWWTERTPPRSRPRPTFLSSSSTRSRYCPPRGINRPSSPTARSAWARTSPTRAVCASPTRPTTIRSKARRSPHRSTASPPNNASIWPTHNSGRRTSATKRSHVSPSSTYTRWASGASTPRCATCKTFTMPSRSPTARCTCPSRSA